MLPGIQISQADGLIGRTSAMKACDRSAIGIGTRSVLIRCA